MGKVGNIHVHHHAPPLYYPDVRRTPISRVSSSPALRLPSRIVTMPRRSTGGRPARRAAPVRNPPQPAHRAPPPAPDQGGGSILGGIGSTIAQGMAFGTGSAIAHRAVDAVLGPHTIQHETVASQAPAAATTPMNNGSTDACSIHSKAFQDCLNNYGSDISKCQFYLDMLNECRQGSGARLGA